MGKYTRLGKNTLIVFMGGAGSKLVGIFMLPLYTRWLSTSDYGITDMVTVYATLLLSIVTCCIYDSIFIFPKGQDFKIQKEYFSSGLSFSLVMLAITACLFVAVSNIPVLYGRDSIFMEYIWLIYGILCTGFLQSFVQQFVRSVGHVKIYSMTGVVLTLATAVYSIAFIPGWGVKGYIYAIILANLSATCYSFVCSRTYRFIDRMAVKKERCVEMLKYSVPLIPNAIMMWLVAALNRPVMESYLGVEAIGIFAVANKFPGILSMLFAIFLQAWSISVLEEFGKKDYAVFYNKILRLGVTMLIFLLCIVTFFSKFMVSFFASQAFFEAWKYIPVLTLGIVFSCISSLSGSHFWATKESKYLFYSSIGGALVAVLGNFLLIPLWGIMGASVSYVLSFVTVALIRIRYGWRYVKIQRLDEYCFMLVIGVLAILTMLYVSVIWIKCVLFLLVFVALGVVNRKLGIVGYQFCLTIKKRLK